MKKSTRYLLIIFIGLITYVPSFFGQLFWDDNDFIVHNKYVTSFQIHKFFTSQAVEGSNKESNYFRPIQFSLYSLLYAANGPHPFLFHVMSVVFHIFAAIMIFLFIETVISTTFRSASLFSNQFHTSGFAIIISILFLIHPIQTEAVSYVSGLSDPLSAFFGFMSLWLFVKTPSNTLPFASLCAFTLALLSKESAVIFVGILCLLWFYQQVLCIHTYTRKNIASIINHFIRYFLPFILITITYLIYHIYVIQILDMKTVWGDHQYTSSILLRIVTFLSIFPTYITLLLYPQTLLYDRDFSVSIPQSIWHFSSFLTASIIITLFILYLLLSLKKSQWYIPFFFYISFFISLLPFSGILLINGLMYEHFLYVPLVFFIGCILSTIITIHNGYKHGTHLHTSKVIALFSLCCCLFIIRSWIRQYEWQDPIRLYSHTLTYVPNSFRVRNNLAMEYQKKGQLQNAIDEYMKTITLNPTIPNPYHNLGNLYLEQKDYTLAEQYFLKALEVNPTFYFSVEGLIKLYQLTGDTQKLKNLLDQIKPAE